MLAAISNAWTEQLLANDGDLQMLVGEAAARGARHVELRMGSLGRCEVGSGTRGTGYRAGDIGAAGDPMWRPVITELQALADAQPALTFNLAVSLRVYADGVDPGGEQMALAIEAAKLLGRSPTPLPPDWDEVASYCGPHLRVVDPQCEGTWLEESDVPEAAIQQTVSLAEEVIGRHGVRFSIENSGGLSFHSMGLLLSLARRRLPQAQASELGLCFDPTNALGPPGDPYEELAALPTDMLMIAHFKQSVDRKMIPTVTDGDVDMARYLTVLAAASYRGPLVFENPPHADALEYLSESFGYIQRLLTQQEGRRAAAL